MKLALNWLKWRTRGKKKFKFEIIGIFSGKKQGKYTGLSYDFSENMVFVDYATSQDALNRAENNKIENKILITEGANFPYIKWR